MIPCGPRTRCSHLKLSAFTFLAVAVCSISVLAQLPEEVTIEPDTEMQAELDASALAMLEGGDSEEEWEREFELGLQRLLSAANGDRRFLMLQTIYWSAHFEDPANRLTAKFVAIFFHDGLKFSDEECLETMLPYLTNRTPYNVRYFTRGMLGHIYHAEDDRGSTIYDFSFFAERIANDSGREPGELDNLIEFIYEEGPGEAVLALMRAHGASSEEIAEMEESWKWSGRMYRRGFKIERDPEFDLDKIMAYLDQYSQSDRWWERLYVAAMLGEVRQLRTDPVLRRLRSDLHPVIRGKLSGIHPKDEP